MVRPGTPLGATVLFLAGARAWTVDDAIADAHARGALDPAIRETLDLAAAEQLAAEQGVEIEDAILQKESERYRYDHDLISAGETEAWLAARGMTLDDFAEWLYARLCVATCSAGLRPAFEGRRDGGTTPSSDDRRDEARRHTEPKDFAERLLIHLWLSGEMERVTGQFRRRVAAQMELASENLSRDAAYDRLARAALTGEARRRKLDSLWLPLTRIHVESLELDSEDAAREACLCVRDDRQSLAEVAAAAGYATKRDVVWAADAGAISPHASFASDGELIGPLHAGDEFKIYQVVRRVEPSLDDPEIATRVDAALLDECFEDLCSRHTQLPVTARTQR